MSSLESHLGLLDCIVRRRKISALCLPLKIYHRVDCFMSDHLNYFVATRHTRIAAAESELVLVIPRCRTDQFSRSFACCCSPVEIAADGVLSVGTLTCLWLRLILSVYFNLFLLLYSLLSIMVQGSSGL